MEIIFKFTHVFRFVFFLFCPVMAFYDNTYIKPESVSILKKDSPSYIDLNVYLPVLNRIVDFCEQNKNILSINLIHGLFLINVNLGAFATDNDISEPLRLDIQKLLTLSEKLQTEFNLAKTGKMKTILAALASNATAWSKRVRKLNYDLLDNTYAHGEYPKWDVYLKTIEDIDKGTPSPGQSDVCIGSLIETEVNLSDDVNLRCELPDDCPRTIINGTDFGYWLTHRLILLLYARLSRNCEIFSAHEDQMYRNEFCERAYREVEYIALNGFQIADLPLEQIGICALDGNAQFLRRSWLNSILDYQQPSGCFQLYKLRPTDAPNIKDCNDHAMAVALATYSAAVRLILQNLKDLMK